MKKINIKSFKLISAALLSALFIGSAFFTFYNFNHGNKLPLVDDTAYNTVSLTDTVGNVSQTDSMKQTVIDEETEPTVENQVVKYVRITASAKVRAEDNSSAKQLAVLQKGTEVKYISESSERYQVEYAGQKSGWIVKSCGEVFDKTITIKHLPKYTSGDPIDMNGTDVGDSLATILKNHNTIGASVAVIKDGKVCYHYEYGYADKEAKVVVEENTKFRIASVTKVFTAMMAMRQVDDGLLDLDKDLSEIMGYTVRNPSYTKVAITERMLLTHTAGMVDRDPVFTGVLRTQLAQKDHYISKPGTKFLYSNFGMGVAGAVMEKTSNQVISEYARDTFFEPMGLDASFDAQYLSDKSLVANCYNGSTLANNNKYLTRSQPWGGPGETFHLTAGGLLISAEDLASLFTILINNGQYNEKQYISEESLNEMLSSQIEPDGFTQCIGIRKKENLVGNRTMYYHNGEAYGIHSLMALDMTDKSGVIVITSGASAVRNDNTIFAVCDDVLNFCYSEIIE